MDQFGNQMRSFAGDAPSQRPQSQPPAQANTPAKPASNGTPQKHHNGCADVKPRLTKEQHDILENHFQQQHKPSTSTKKGFAEALGVPVDKINNWFQNRRAKVKQDIKKQMNQYNMNMGMGMYATPQMPIVTSQFPPHNEQPQPPPPMGQDFYPMPVTADISPTCLPVQSIEGPSALDLGAQMSLHPPYDMHSLRPIPEGDRSTLYNASTVMQSFIAATAGASYLQNGAASLPLQDSGYSYDTSGLPHAFGSDLGYSVPAALPNDNAGSTDVLNDFAEFPPLDYSSLTHTTTTGSTDVQNSTGSLSSEPSPFSGAHSRSSATTQSSSAGPHPSAVQSIASMYSGWRDDQKSGSDFGPSNQSDGPFDPPYSMLQASTSEHSLPPWGRNGQGQSFRQTDMYQHPNASANAILASPESEDRKLSLGPSDLEGPPVLGDDAFSRRNSSTTNLANNIEAIHIQNSSTPDHFMQPNPPSSIAARRHKRPTALNSTTLRSASYTSGMPSPGASNEHTLRRIRSSGIPNAAGRVQKPTPGSAQRSPMALTFAEAAASPKFSRAFSSSHPATVGQSGTLAPPTPLTPNGFPHWQGSAVIRTHPIMPEQSSPESLNVNWSAEPQSAGLHSSAASPSSTQLDLTQLNPAHYANDSMYRDTPPQSAPATQPAFPRSLFMAPPQMRNGFHSTTDLTIAQPKPSHFRRPSLPDTGHIPLDETQIYSFSELNYEQHYRDISLDGISHNIPFAPPIAMPEFLVHEYTPPHGGEAPALLRRTTEPQPKSYIFANQGPRDFK